MANNFFYGLEGANLYKIYVSEMALNGARVGSNVYDAQTARAMTVHFGILGWFIGSQMAKKAVRTRAEAETKYDALEPGSPPFREGHKANFSLAGSEIQSAIITPKAGGIKGAFSAGPLLELGVAGGKKRKFLLIEDQNLANIKTLLSRLVPNVGLQNQK